MGKIRLLADETASQVAAGEVVERPASLVKELVENSLDAGATRIQIEFARGGARSVTVRDDGSGMDQEDARMCLERHATSKIRVGGDLATVRTMGFRGEALPSIASVSRFRLVTRESAADAGTEVVVTGGLVEAVREIGAPPGTQVEVKDLFFNLPARKKFLRGEETESAQILHGLEAMALAVPGVAFECLRDGRSILSLPRAGHLAVRIRDLFGADHLERLREIAPQEEGGIRVEGYLARPGEGRRDRLRQIVILNGRPIHCPAVQQPLREAYAEALGRGLHPSCVLIITMDTALVDCNVHPAKREVRLSDPEILRRMVFEAARATILQARQDLVVPILAARPEPAPVFHPRPPQQDLSWDSKAAGVATDVGPEVTLGIEGSEEVALSSPEELPEVFRLLGTLSDGYLVLEGAEGLVVLDVRAAGERILFEGLMRQLADGAVSSQRLLLPEVVELPARERAWVLDHLDDLQASGFQLEPFGGLTVKIEALPAAAAERDPGRLLHDTVSAVRATGKLVRGRGVREAVARSVARLATGETVLGDDGARRLVRQLLRCELPYASPAGRPTMIQFSRSELARKFGRSR